MISKIGKRLRPSKYETDCVAFSYGGLYCWNTQHMFRYRNQNLVRILFVATTKKAKKIGYFSKS